MSLTFFLIDKAVKMCGSQRRLADHLGVNHSAPSDWLKGKSIPTELQVAKMAELTGVRIDDALLARSEAALEKTDEGRRLLEVMKGGFLRGAVATFAIFATLLAAPETSDVRGVCQKAADAIYIV